MTPVAPQQLRAPVRVRVQQVSGRIVVADGDERAIQGVMQVDMGIAHAGVLRLPAAGSHGGCSGVG